MNDRQKLLQEVSDKLELWQRVHRWPCMANFLEWLNMRRDEEADGHVYKGPIKDVHDPCTTEEPDGVTVDTWHKDGPLSFWNDPEEDVY